MDADATRTLTEKIEALSEDDQERVHAFVQKLLHDSDQNEPEPRYLDQSWAGALRDLKDEYSSLELEDEIMKQWMEAAHD